MYKIRRTYSSAFEDESQIILLALSTKHQTDGTTNLSVQIGEMPHRFATKAAETRAANRLRSLVQTLNLRIPSNWRDESETCDGWTNDLNIECGYNKLHFHWFCDCPPEWTPVSKLADAIDDIANKLRSLSRSV
jgi:hypothetical protein